MQEIIYTLLQDLKELQFNENSGDCYRIRKLNAKKK